jgi:hypothetical protein
MLPLLLPAWEPTTSIAALPCKSEGQARGCGVQHLSSGFRGSSAQGSGVHQLRVQQSSSWAGNVTLLIIHGSMGSGFRVKPFIRACAPHHPWIIHASRGSGFRVQDQTVHVCMRFSSSIDHPWIIHRSRSSGFRVQGQAVYSCASHHPWRCTPSLPHADHAPICLCRIPAGQGCKGSGFRVQGSKGWRTHLCALLLLHGDSNHPLYPACYLTLNPKPSCRPADPPTFVRPSSSMEMYTISSAGLKSENFADLLKT